MQYKVTQHPESKKIMMSGFEILAHHELKPMTVTH